MKKEPPILSNEALQKKIAFFEVVMNLIEKTDSYLDVQSVMKSVLEAYAKTLSFYTISFFVMEKLEISKTNIIHVFSNSRVGRNYLKSVQYEMLKFVENIEKESNAEADHITAEQYKKVSAILGGHLYFDFVGGGMTVDEHTGTIPLHSFLIPLQFGEEVVGLFHIASIESKPFTALQIEQAETLANLAAASLKRAHDFIQMSDAGPIGELLSGMADGVLIFNLDRKTLVSNNALCKLSNLGKDDLNLNNLMDVLKNSLKTDNPTLLAKIEETLAGMKKAHFSGASINGVSHDIWIFPLNNANQKLNAGAMVFHDVSAVKELKEIELLNEKLKGVKDYTENIIQSMAETLVVLKPAGTIELVNQELLCLLGYEKKELIGKHVGIILASLQKKKKNVILTPLSVHV